MLKQRMSVPLEDDCFYKMMNSFIIQDEKVRSRLGIIHSRYASLKGKIKDSLAHPNFDDKNRLVVFHNGFIANYEDLSKQLKKN